MNKNVNIELFVLCYNEEKVINHTLNYYSKFCSRINIIDNISTDKSLEIAKNHHFKNIEVIKLNSGGEYREDLMIDMRNNCWKNSKADYVIVCDMDEFLYAENMIEQLIKAKNRDVVLPVVIGYNMMSSSFPNNQELPLNQQVKEGFRDRTFDKNIIFNPRKIEEINFGPGSHHCFPKFSDKMLIRDELVEFKLLHYKYLGKEYLYKKHEIYSNRMSEVNKKHNFGHEYSLGSKHIDNVFQLFNNYLIKII